MIVIGILLGLTDAVQSKDIFYTLVVDWAVLGILLKRMATDSNAAQGVIIATIVGISLLTIGIVFQIIRGKVYR